MTDVNQTYFHECLVAFITVGFRLSTWHWTSSWNNFHAEFQCPGYEDLTPIQLKDTFSREVLPNVFTYDLPVEQREKVNLLETYQVCGPKVNRTEQGYVVATDTQRAIELADDPDFPTFQSELHHNGQNALVLLKSKDWDTMMAEIDGDLSIRKCVSMCLQKEKERLQENLLTWREIKERWSNKHIISTVEECTEEFKFFEQMNHAVRKHFQRKLYGQRQPPALTSAMEREPLPSSSAVQSTPIPSTSAIPAQASATQSTPLPSTSGIPTQTSAMSSTPLPSTSGFRARPRAMQMQSTPLTSTRGIYYF